MVSDCYAVRSGVDPDNLSWYDERPNFMCTYVDWPTCYHFQILSLKLSLYMIRIGLYFR